MTVTRALVAGPDVDGLGDALAAEGVDVTRVDGVLTADALETAGVDDADLFVLTDLDEATAIPVAKERNPGLRVVVYAHRSLPEFVRGLTDLAVDPSLLSADVVAEELV